MIPTLRLLATILLCLLRPELAQAQVAEAPFAVSIEHPAEGQAVGALQGLAFVAGRAAGLSQPQVDLVFVVDVSDSTHEPSGLDLNGDGREGPRDSVFALQLRVISTLLVQLDATTTRVGLVAYSGDQDPETIDAEVIVTLSADHAKLRAGLGELSARGPAGISNLRDGIELAADQFRRKDRKTSAAAAPRTMILISDGFPNITYDFSSSAEKRRRILEAAEVARRKDISIHAYGIAPDGDRPRGEDLLMEIARATRGEYSAVGNPNKVYSPLSDETSRKVPVASVVLENAGLGALAEQFELNPDGSFWALVPVRPGSNSIVVTLESVDGARVIRTFELNVKTGAPLEPSDPELADARRRLFERWSARVAPTR